MAVIQKIYGLTYLSQSSLSYSRRLRLPLLVDLPELPPPLLANVGDSYNCNRCAESPYFLPFVHGDVLPLQYRFLDEYHNDPSDIFIGWKTSTLDGYIQIKVYDGENDALLFSNADEVSSYFNVGYNPAEGSIQTLFFDTTNLPLNVNCFYYEICLFKDGGGGVPSLIKTYISEKYLKIKCADTVVFSAIYSKFDCLGRFYGNVINILGSPYEPFKDTFRVQGFVDFLGKFKSKVLTDENIEISVETVERYVLKTPALAPFAACLLDAVTNGKEVTVDGETRFNFGDIDKNNNDSKAFFVDLTFESKPCKIKRFSCD